MGIEFEYLKTVPEGTLIDWLRSNEAVEYAEASRWMSDRVDLISAGNAPETVWLLRHHPVITAGTSTPADQIKGLDDGASFHRSTRGGKLTWHGPGQRVIYVMLDLNRRQRDLRSFVGALCGWVSAALQPFGIEATQRSDRIGLWVKADGIEREEKIAALGLRVRRWVTSHGIAINVALPEYAFHGFAPCGIEDPRYGVTSIARQVAVSGGGRVDEAFALLDASLLCESWRLEQWPGEER